MRREPDSFRADLDRIGREAGEETARVIGQLAARIESALDDRGRIRNDFEVATVRANKVVLPALGRLYFDGESDSYIWEAASDQVQIVVSGSGAFKVITTGSVFTSALKGTTGDPTGEEGLITINTFDNKVKIYADGAWQELATW